MKSLNKILTGIIGIVFSLLVGALLIKIQGNSPIIAYKALYDYGLGSWFSITSTLNNSTPLILTGIAAAIAFSSNVNNLGQPGQLIIGALSAALLGYYLPFPGWIGITTIIILSGIIGGFYASIAGVFKKLYKMDEMLTTLMLNFIADYLTIYLATYPFLDKKSYVPATKMIKKEFFLPSFKNLNSSFFIAILIALISYFIVKYLKKGYEWRMMGYNPDFSRIGGCDNEQNLMWIMFYTGFLSGLAGALLILGGTQHRFIKGIGANYGWDGIMLSIVGANGIFETSFFSLFFGFLKAGGVGMEFEVSIPSEFIMVLQATIVLLVVSTRSLVSFYGDKMKAYFKTRKVVKAHE